MPDEIFHCFWQQTRTRFKIWLSTDPTVVGVGADYDRAEEMIRESIDRKYRAWDVYLQFDPPLPGNVVEQQYMEPLAYKLSGNEAIELLGISSMSAFDRTAAARWQMRVEDLLFTSKVCAGCKRRVADRSVNPLMIEEGLSGTDAGHVFLPSTDSITVLSESFLGLLTEEERAGLELAPVQIKKRCKQQLFELAGPIGPASVAVADMLFGGLQCVICHHVSFMPDLGGGRYRIVDLVARSEFPRQVPSIFTIGSPPSLCMRAERWRQLKGRRGTRGVATNPIGFVPADKVLKVPSHPLRVVGKHS